MNRFILSTFIFVCLSITVNYGVHSVYAQEPVDALSDLVGAKGGQAEGELKSRGYTWVNTDKSAGVYSYWTEDSTGKCVIIHVEDGRYQSIVYAPKSDCENQKGSSSEPEQDPNTVAALSDLVGAKGGQAETEVKSRGYTWVKTDKSGGSSYSYWTENDSGKCVTIRTADGRYQSIIYTPKFDCKNGTTAKSEPVTATVEGHCKLYNKKSDNNKYKGSCTIKQKMTDDSNKFVIKLGNGDTYKFIEQSNGYEVHTPEGVSKNTATMTDHGNKAVFKWGKWKLTAKQN